jgi:hypothetical protein
MAEDEPCVKGKLDMDRKGTTSSGRYKDVDILVTTTYEGGASNIAPVTAHG